MRPLSNPYAVRRHITVMFRFGARLASRRAENHLASRGDDDRVLQSPRPTARIPYHGHRSTWNGPVILRALVRLHQVLFQYLTDREREMLFEYILGGAVTLFLLAYLTYALVRPERF